MTKLIDAATRGRFRRDGYVVVAGLLTDAELDHYEPLVTAAVAHRTALDTRALADKSLYEQSFSQCMNLWDAARSRGTRRSTATTSARS